MTAPNPADGSNDPYVWLEEIEGEKAVGWVEAQNARTDGFLCDDSYQRDFDAVMKILDADDRIPSSESLATISIISGKTPLIRAGFGAARRWRATRPIRLNGTCCSTSMH